MLLTFVVTLLNFSCQKQALNELEYLSSQKQSKIKATITNGKIQFSNSENLSKHIRNFTSKNKNISSRTVTSNEYGFEIDTSRVQLIETNSYKSYTFL